MITKFKVQNAKLKILLRIILFFLTFHFAVLTPVFAQTNNYISIVNPVRGEEFWNLKNQKVETAVLGEERIHDKYSIPATWLLRFDALDNTSLTTSLRDRKNDELGVLLEVTPKLTSSAGVPYHKSQSWHSAGSVFLTGYSQEDRIKLIDTAFEKFKSDFGYYPVSVGAWWVDSYSLQYMQSKYSVSSLMIVADQYSTDNYQIWGQYWGTPYYPNKGNNLIPAQDENSKVPVVITQWATRDPVNGYGSGVEESTYSFQANDYLDYHNLTTDYFGKLVDLYMKQPFNKFNQLTVGLENSYSWDKYKSEYENQIKALVNKKNSGELNLATMSGFSHFYMSTFPKTSPTQIIIADDPLGSFKKSIWFMNNYYRAGWVYDAKGSYFRDIRQYINGSSELCLRTACDSLNFATTATRVLDDVSFNQRWELDQGKISGFQTKLEGENPTFSYLNEAGKKQVISFLPRDLSLNAKPSTIDGAILDAIKNSLTSSNTLYPNNAKGTLQSPLLLQLFNVLKFIVFLLFSIFIPGYFLLKKAKLESEKESFFLSIAIGLVIFTLLIFILGFFGLWVLLYGYSLLGGIWFFKTRSYRSLKPPSVKKWTLILMIAGSLFQLIPTVKSGLFYDFGIGYWGPNGHDGIWHIALSNQILQGIFPQNPVFSGTTLKNYHYFYDLLLGGTFYQTKIPVPDLLFRIYPFLISLLIGLGSYTLLKKLFKSEKASFFSLYLIYFAGSFGWIVEFIKERHLGGESAFWANQSISLNLNPPFAISLVFILAIFELIFLIERTKSRILQGALVLLAGVLIEFKSYGGILVLGSLGIFGLYRFLMKKDLSYLFIAIFSGVLSLVIFLPNVTFQQFFIFSPLWLVHTMIDFPDRVGWERLSTARSAYLARGNWLKLILVESIGIGMFIAGNLGMRIFGLFKVLKLEALKPVKVFFLSFLALSFIIPFLFIQAGTNWNIIQFFYYFLFIIALFAGATLDKIFTLTPKNLGVLVVGIIIILTPINSISTALGYFGIRPHAFISYGEYEVLNFLSTQPKGVVLTYPYTSNLRERVSDPRPLFAYDSSAYVSAYSAHPSFIEDYEQNDILQTPYIKRIVQSKDFFTAQNNENRKVFLKENNIKFIYLSRYFSFPIDESALSVNKIFESKDASLYMVH